MEREEDGIFAGLVPPSLGCFHQSTTILTEKFASSNGSPLTQQILTPHLISSLVISEGGTPRLEVGQLWVYIMPPSSL